jgi:hypothetical protein
MAIHDQQPNVVVTITPEDTLRAALNQRPDGISGQRWADYNRRFNALLMGRDGELPPYAPPLVAEPRRVPLLHAPRPLPPPRRRNIDWAEVGGVVLLGLGALAVDLSVALSLGAALGIMGLVLVGRGFLMLSEL